MTALSENMDQHKFYTTSLAEIKQEAMDQTDTSSPIDLSMASIRTHPLNEVNTYLSYPLSPPYTCSTTPNSFEHKRRTSLGSSPRSNSSADSAELSSTTSDNYVGITPTFSHNSHRTKATRPFKAYPKDPMSLSMNSSAIDLMMGNLGTESAAYVEFRAKMLEQVQAQHTSTTNKNMRRNTNSTQNPQNGDPTYWEKRRKNNEAAKRSRDARRAKEDEIAIRCAFLEHEHIRIKHENQQVRNENMHLQYRLARLQSELDSLQNKRYR